jgi:hypothetical protein
LAYVAVTLRGGSEQARERIRQALLSYFESGWGEVAVELSHDGFQWRIDSAWSNPPGRRREEPDAWALDCRDKVASALLAVGALAARARR